MIWPVVSFIVALRSPLTATVEVDAFARGLAAEHVDHAAEHAGELDVVFSSARTSARSE